MDETPLRTTDLLPFFVLFERVVDDDAPVVVIVDDEDEEVAVRFMRILPSYTHLTFL